MINVYWKNTYNFGDKMSALANYLPMETIDWQEVCGKEPELVAGGGIIPLGKAQKLEGKYYIIGGGGTENKPSDLPTNAGIIGWRDYQTAPKGCWCPCLSCLSPLLDIEYESKREVGVVQNSEYIKFAGGILNTNEQMIRYIGESEIIYTNSYHAIYWAKLMNKQVCILEDRPKLHSLPYELNLEECRKICKEKIEQLKAV